MVKFAFFDIDGTLAAPLYRTERGLTCCFTPDGWRKHCAKRGVYHPIYSLFDAGNDG